MLEEKKKKNLRLISKNEKITFKKYNLNRIFFSISNNKNIYLNHKD